MTCKAHPWAIPTANGCPSCWIGGLVQEQLAIEGERNAKRASAKVRKRREAIHGKNLAQATFEMGLTNSQRRNREQAAQKRAEAVKRLEAGEDPRDISLSLGRHREWCRQQADKHPALSRALRNWEAKQC